jgi:hypothetical protein
VLWALRTLAVGEETRVCVADRFEEAPQAASTVIVAIATTGDARARPVVIST